MTNIERFFGLAIKVSDDVEPARLAILQERAQFILSQLEYDPSDYTVYYHQLHWRARPNHFGLGPNLADRIRKICLAFDVNQKQRRTGAIKLFNHMVEQDLPPGIIRESDSEQVHFFVEERYFSDRREFRSELITLIHKRVRRDHRKIKLTVTVEPTEGLSRKLHDHAKDRVTRLDLMFIRRLEQGSLRVAKRELESRRLRSHRRQSTETQIGSPEMTGEGKFTNQFNFHGPTNVVSANTAQNFTQTASLASLLSDASLRSQLMRDIEIVRTQARVEGRAEADLEALSEASQAVSDSDEPRMIQAMRKTGAWLLDLGTRVGAGMLVEVLRRHIFPTA